MAWNWEEFALEESDFTERVSLADAKMIGKKFVVVIRTPDFSDSEYIRYFDAGDYTTPFNIGRKV
jgi:hypothetical protein